MLLIWIFSFNQKIEAVNDKTDILISLLLKFQKTKVSDFLKKLIFI